VQLDRSGDFAARFYLAESLDISRALNNRDGTIYETLNLGLAEYLVARGLSNPEIAQRLILSEHTVHRHLANIRRKLNLSSRAAAAAWGVRVGLI
jgi:FixJ family two-component response regulator